MNFASKWDVRHHCVNAGERASQQYVGPGMAWVSCVAGSHVTVLLRSMRLRNWETWSAGLTLSENCFLRMCSAMIRMEASLNFSSKRRVSSGQLLYRDGSLSTH